MSDNESARLAALRSYGVLDSPSEGAFDDITRIAALICEAPIALVSLVESERQWFKSAHGLAAKETPIEQSVCAHAILQTDVFVVDDTAADVRFHANPLVTGAPGMRFYAGAPLLTADGLALGTVCVLDSKPRTLGAEQREALRALARQAMAQLELRKALLRAEQVGHYRSRLMAAVGHDLKAPLRVASYAIHKVRRATDAALAPTLTEAAEALGQINAEFDKLLAAATAEDLDALPTPSAFPLADVLGPLARAWRKTAERKGLAFRYVACSASVVSHPVLLSTIVGNLLSNAVKYTPPGGTILLGARRRPGTLSIEVIDTGIGIDADTGHHVFKAFRQADSASDGLGLGLWIVARTAAMLGHAVTLASTPGRGTRFTVSVARPHGAPAES